MSDMSLRVGVATGRVIKPSNLLKSLKSWHGEQYLERYHLRMSAADRILSRMRQNPRDWRIEDLEVVARRYSVAVRKRGGSHVVFSHEQAVRIVTVPARRPVKAPDV